MRVEDAGDYENTFGHTGNRNICFLDEESTLDTPIFRIVEDATRDELLQAREQLQHVILGFKDEEAQIRELLAELSKKARLKRSYQNLHTELSRRIKDENRRLGDEQNREDARQFIYLAKEVLPHEVYLEIWNEVNRRKTTPNLKKNEPFFESTKHQEPSHAK